jgi:hypothetical protein
VEGWIKIHRKIIDSEIWSKPPLYLKVWMYLLLRAQHSDYKKLKCGQLYTSIPEIQEACAWKSGYRTEKPSKDQVFQILSWMRTVSHGMDTEGYTGATTGATMITTTRATQGMLVNIDNYRVYQTSEYDGGNSKEDTGATTEKLREQRSPDNINKNVKNEKKKTSQQKKKSASKIYADDTVEMNLSKYLLTRIQEWNPKYKAKNIQTWCDDMRKLIHLDQQNVEDIMHTAAWATKHEFWRSNILSAAALRKQYDKLQAKMISEKKKVVPMKDNSDTYLLSDYIADGGTIGNAEEFQEWKKRRLQQ